MAKTLDAWLTKQQAAQFLGVAEKTIDRMADRKEIQKAKRKRPGLPPLAVFHPEDLARIKEAGAESESPEAFMVPENGIVRSPAPQLLPAQAPQLLPAQATMVDLFLAALTDRLTKTETKEPAPPPLKEPYLLTLKEARKVSGLTKKRLEQFAVKLDGRWCVPHAQLEAFCRNVSNTLDTSKEVPVKQLAEVR